MSNAANRIELVNNNSENQRITRFCVLDDLQFVVIRLELLHAISNMQLVVFQIRADRYNALATSITDLKR